jgi:hypothetical protein
MGEQTYLLAILATIYMGETNSPSVAHVGYDISTPSRVKFNTLECRNIVTHGNRRRIYM